MNGFQLLGFLGVVVATALAYYTGYRAGKLDGKLEARREAENNAFETTAGWKERSIVMENRLVNLKQFLRAALDSNPEL